MQGGGAGEDYTGLFEKVQEKLASVNAYTGNKSYNELSAPNLPQHH